jgi:hypothetical protein
VLVNAVGSKTPTVIPLAIVLGTIGVMVSLLSIVQPDYQQEAALLGAVPRLVALDGAAVAGSATAFDGNPSVFSPADQKGVFNALGLAAIVVWGLFAVLAGSTHAAAAILDDPWRYDRKAPFRPSVRRGPVPTQRGVFGAQPRRIHTPVAADLIRNAALYVLVVLGLVWSLIRDYAAEETGLIEYWRVGAAEVAWTVVLMVFPIALAGSYLVVRHRRASDGRARPPPRGWRVALGTLFALAAAACMMGAATWASGARLTPGADLDIYSSAYYLEGTDLARFHDVPDSKVQSLSYYEVDVASSDGLITADLVVTEMPTAADFLSANVADELGGSARVRSQKPSGGSDELPEVWVSEALAERLDPATGDEVVATDADGLMFTARASAVFSTPGVEAPIVVLDVPDFPGGVDSLLIDEILVQATDGALRDGSDTMAGVEDLVEELDLEMIDLRREIVRSNEEGPWFAVLFLVCASAAVLIAFGRPSRWAGPDAPLAPGATRAAGPRPAQLPPPVLAARAAEPSVTTEATGSGP